MKKVDKLVFAPHIYTMEGEGVGYRGNAAMAVDCGKVIEVGDREYMLKEYVAEETIELNNHMVLPGFVDGHMHTACNILRGLAQDTNNWMMYGLQPFDNAINQEERDAGSRVAILEAVRAGTTTLGDYELEMEPVCEFIEKLGARGNIAQLIRAAKKGAVIVFVGYSATGEMTLPIGMALDKELTFKTVFRYRNIYPMAIEAVAGGKIRIKDIVTDYFELDDIKNALDSCVHNKADIVKGVIKVC